MGVKVKNLKLFEDEALKIEIFRDWREIQKSETIAEK